MNLKTHLKKLLNKQKLYPHFGKGFINISNKSGMHCEFYGEIKKCDGYLTATYRLKNTGRPKSLFFTFPAEIEGFVTAVTNIFKVS